VGNKGTRTAPVLDMMSEMSAPEKVNINDVIDKSRLGLFQWGLFVLCGLCLIMDGFDLQAIGFVAPALIRDWKIPSSSMGPVFSAALVGVFIGSLMFSMLADRIGRRPVLVGVTLYFSVLTFLTARVGSVNELLIVRFLGGIGLGGIMPNAMALVGEYTPSRIRVTAMMVVSNGFTLGAAFGGPIAAYLIPHYGWRGVFYFGAVTPLAIAALMILLLPESLQFLALRGKDPAKVARWLKRVEPDLEVSADTEYVLPEGKKKGVPIVQLFHDGRALGTALLWVVNFMNLLNLYLLSNWLPTVVRDSGYSNTIAVNSGSIFQVGGVVGTLVLGLFVRRFGFTVVLSACFALACLSIAAIGLPYLSLAVLFAFIFVAGFGIPGSQAGLNAFSATYYPTDLRASGVGAGLGIGRIGAIVGPLIVGIMLGHHWGNREIFIAAAVPALISCIVMFSLRWVIEPSSTTVRAGEVLVH
jgi:MFS transporter, AAHS family, 4-hydroxybenzoate transporter